MRSRPQNCGQSAAEAVGKWKRLEARNREVKKVSWEILTMGRFTPARSAGAGPPPARMLCMITKTFGNAGIFVVEA